jgi:hypothetical protein
LSAVEAWVPPSDCAFAIVGDSITDGRGSDNDANNRYVRLVLAIAASILKIYADLVLAGLTSC